MERTLDSSQKAFDINLDDTIYGTFAEIGAGQEVARHFFRAGGAAGTIAKSMSAYDMAVSDDIYGKSGRYVSQDRLETMLEKEFEQLQDRLSEGRGKGTSFFVFADTVAARSFKYTADRHGWLGVRFQHESQATPSQIILHVKMYDKVNLQQQEALGILGTNLIYNCFRTCGDRVAFVKSLMDNLSKDRLSIDLIEVSGPGFAHEDHRLWPLELVKRGYTEAVLFNKDGHMSQVKDTLYKKNILISRGSYRPPTLVNMDMLDKGKEAFVKALKNHDEAIAKGEVIVLPEISMSKLKERGEVLSEDFLARVDLVNSLGLSCLITSYSTYGQLSKYLSDNSNYRMAFVLGFYNLKEVFDHEDYAGNIGKLLTGLGKLLGERGELFVYPAANEKKGGLLRTADATVGSDIKPLISYLEGTGKITNIEEVNRDHFTIWSRTVLKMIQSGESGWEKMVPDVVAKQVKQKCLFDYPCETK